MHSFFDVILSDYSPERFGSIIERRLALDRPTTSPLDAFSFYQVFCALKSPHVIVLMAALFMNGTTLYGLALFLPSIVNQLGYSATRTQLISVGPFALAFVGGCARTQNAILADDIALRL
jgi:hypothetical protein